VRNGWPIAKGWVEVKGSQKVGEELSVAELPLTSAITWRYQQCTYSILHFFAKLLSRYITQKPNHFPAEKSNIGDKP